ncbi:hypothetical protein [Mycobacterium shimoidei]|uniref:hypothetical protein n=1 Tax=Mycobacterium shimoidei TaxID=29313 RepID=UPI000848A92E|nr:hypothetical protein [Mycobacterium shimoidei]MCV7258014.1 hypothetical protein [Mycobacterium shimoidei]ODR05655.1 hypothetical protein BHQ16_22050 [Mycobacterium shimoidei]ORW76011.1 hypothetical protein AWC26_22295 [Mycobacterium shimoidei]
MTDTRTNQTVASSTGVDAQAITDRQRLTRTPCPASREQFTAWLTASCKRQNLPITITDPTTLATVATLLR